MIGAVVLVLVAALLLAWLLKGKHREGQDMASQTSGSTPIIGFPGVGGEQKPQLVNEASAPQDAGQVAQGTQATGLIPSVDLKLPEGSVANTTGFDLRPAGGEVRTVVDTDNKVKEGTGNMGTGDAKAVAGTANPAPAQTEAVAPAAQQAETKSLAIPPVASGSMQDKPATGKTTEAAPVEKRPASRVVVVNEKPVPAAQSVESASSRKAAEAKAKQAAADKAAAEKSLKLAAEKAKATGSATSTATSSAGGAAAAGNGFAIQVMASTDKAKADALAKSLANDGNKAAVAEAKVDGKVFYRVRISGFQKRDEAVAAQAKLKARYTQNQYVQNSFVTK
jgi:cell division protein FtsN